MVKRKIELEGWGSQALTTSEKTIGSFSIEMIGAKEGGAHINVWEPMPKNGKNLAHINAPSDDGLFRKVDEIHFWNYSNAKEEYSALKTARTVIDLMWRNA